MDLTKTDQEYAGLALKSTPGIPEWGIYDAGYPNGVLVLWPVPYQAATMTILQNKAFTAATALTDSFQMPPGYRKMVRLLLSWELASDYPGMSGPELEKLSGDAKEARALVKRNNRKPEFLRSDVSRLDCSGGGSFGNWRNGA